MAETNFRQALLSEGTWTVFFTNPLSLGLLLLAVISLVWPIVQGRRAKAAEGKTGS
jgi:putative tricarboxylic transport membrane protein